jgi:peptidoglycan hydrolase-like protein with peptidoglycan-binding domain
MHAELQVKGEGCTLGHSLKVARIGMLLLAGGLLSLPAGWAQSPKHSTKKAIVPTSASSPKGATASAAKKTPTRAKSGTRGKSRRVSSRASRREKGQKTPTPDRITEIQQALGKNGAYASQPSGKWDASTVEAVRKFQAGHGLNASGKLDAKTLQQLGLGSTTAGIAPPAPTVTSVNRLTSSNTAAGQRQ